MIDREQLIETWHEITGDSYVVDVRKVKKDKDFGYSKAAAEVCKYALKFSELSVENTWEAFKVLKGKRLRVLLALCMVSKFLKILLMICQMKKIFRI